MPRKSAPSLPTNDKGSLDVGHQINLVHTQAGVSLKMSCSIGPRRELCWWGAKWVVDRNMADRKTRPTLAMIGLPRYCAQSGVCTVHCAKEDLKR